MTCNFQTITLTLAANHHVLHLLQQLGPNNRHTTNFSKEQKCFLLRMRASIDLCSWGVAYLLRDTIRHDSFKICMRLTCLYVLATAGRCQCRRQIYPSFLSSTTPFPIHPIGFQLWYYGLLLLLILVLGFFWEAVCLHVPGVIGRKSLWLKLTSVFS